MRDARAQQVELAPRTTYGSVGLVEMPSARMVPDGEAWASASYSQRSQRYTLNFQALPWLEASFRYSGLSRFDRSFSVYWDRSFAMKMRLFNESEYTPAIVIGANDLIGTGIYGGEFITASKQIGNLDFTLGLGWGRLGTANTFRNPLGAISSSFYNRGNGPATGGQFNFGQYLHGPTVGVFGGLNWRTPLPGLTLSAELSSDSYTRESTSGNLNPNTQLNVAASYQLGEGTLLSAQYLYGATWGLNFTFAVDPTRPQYPANSGPQVPAVSIRAQEQQSQAIAAMQGRLVLMPPVSRPDRNGFVDALFASGQNFSDIQTVGHTLVLTAQAGNPRCEAVATLARKHDMDIDSVQLRGSGNSSCAVPQPTALTSAADKAAIARIKTDITDQRLAFEGMSLTASEAIIYYRNEIYATEDQAVGRIIRVLMADLPPRIEKMRIIAVNNGLPQRRFDVIRGSMERLMDQDNGVALLNQAMTISPPAMAEPGLKQTLRVSYPRFTWGISPQLRQGLFDPVDPFAVQILVGIGASFSPVPGLNFSGAADTSVYDTFNTARTSDSVLPHVRTDMLQYLLHGKTGIGNLKADYRFRISPQLTALVRAGYLEDMFGGVGGELLWRPAGQRWALGVDVYEAWQRNFDRLFGFQKYHVLTGHMSLYYQSPWYDLNFALRAGRYLAGDKGVTLEVTRRFATGMEIGAFATKTNVPAARFGEGSFDKGIIIRIPLSWMLPIPTQSQLAMDMRPIQRDGGQRLLNDTVLAEATRRTSEGEMLLHQAEFLNPDGSD